MITLFNDGKINNVELSHRLKHPAVDFIHCTTSEDSYVNLLNLKINSFIETNVAHYDAIQIIPKSSFFNSQYYGFNAGNFFLGNLEIFSKNSLQGVFCSDGLIESFQIHSSTINVGSTHSITLSGCKFFYGTNLHLNTPVKLYPLRLLGNITGKENSYVGIEDSYLKTDSTFEVLDYRKDPSFLRSGDIFLYNFDFKKFESLIIEFLTKNNSNTLAKNLKAAKKIVLSCGEV